MFLFLCNIYISIRVKSLVSGHFALLSRGLARPPKEGYLLVINKSPLSQLSFHSPC